MSSASTQVRRMASLCAQRDQGVTRGSFFTTCHFSNYGQDTQKCDFLKMTNHEYFNRCVSEGHGSVGAGKSLHWWVHRSSSSSLGAGPSSSHETTREPLEQAGSLISPKIIGCLYSSMGLLLKAGVCALSSI